MEQHGELRLRSFEDGDIELLRKWLCETHVARWYEQPQAWLAEVEARRSEYSWIHHFIAQLDGAPMGFCQYYEYRRGGETWHGSCDTEGGYSIDYLLGDPAHIGKGLGKQLIMALTEQVALEQNAKFIIVQPEPENKASCGALISAGFEYDGENRLYRLELSKRQSE